MPRKAIANIRVKPATRDRLRAAKIGGETYDETINRLLNVMDDSNYTDNTAGDRP